MSKVFGSQEITKNLSVAENATIDGTEVKVSNIPSVSQISGANNMVGQDSQGRLIKTPLPGIGGPCFITDLAPQSSGNVTKTTSFNGRILATANTSTNQVRVSVYFERGDSTLYQPTVFLDYGVTGQSITTIPSNPTSGPFVPVEVVDGLVRGGWTANIDITLPTLTGGATTWTITLRNGSVTYSVVVGSISVPEVTGATIVDSTGADEVGIRTQTQFKSGDTFLFDITVPSGIAANITSITFLATSNTLFSTPIVINSGSFISVVGGTIRVSATINNSTDNTGTNRPFEVIVTDNNGTNSSVFNSGVSSLPVSTGSYPSVSTTFNCTALPLNNSLPTTTVGTITYPTNKTALSTNDVLTVAFTPGAGVVVTGVTGSNFASPVISTSTPGSAGSFTIQYTGTNQYTTVPLTLNILRASNRRTSTVNTSNINIASSLITLQSVTPTNARSGPGVNGNLITVTITASQRLTTVSGQTPQIGDLSLTWVSDNAAVPNTQIAIVGPITIGTVGSTFNVTQTFSFQLRVFDIAERRQFRINVANLRNTANINNTNQSVQITVKGFISRDISVPINQIQTKWFQVGTIENFITNPADLRYSPTLTTPGSTNAIGIKRDGQPDSAYSNVNYFNGTIEQANDGNANPSAQFVVNTSGQVSATDSATGSIIPTRAAVRLDNQTFTLVTPSNAIIRIEEI